MQSIIQLARESIQKIIPYSSARIESTQLGIHLDANENPFGRKDGLNRYPYQQPAFLRQKLAEMYGVESFQLMMTRGSDEGIDLLVRVFCEANRDAIMITPPTYGMYEVAARIQGAKIISIPLDSASGFTLNRNAILQQWHPAIKLMFLCSPNNPTGNILNKDAIINLCEQLQNKTLIVLDEAYVEFSKTESLSRYVSRYPNLVILRTLSKAFGLAGARLGSLIANQAIISLLTKVIAPYPIPLPVENAAIDAISVENQAIVRGQIQTIQQEREKLHHFLETLPSVERVYPSQANYLLVKVKDAAKWMTRCKQHQIILRARHRMKGLENCVRITIGTREEIDYLKTVLSYE